MQAGLIYSAVQLDSGGMGVAYTFPQTRGGCGSGCGEGKPLVVRKAAELLGGLGGGELFTSTMGLAAANALLACAPLPVQAREGDVLESLEFRPGDQVCMVGCFVPLLKPLKALGVSVTAVDQVPKPGSLPAQEVEKYLPSSQVAIITATSLINGTLDRLLELASSCREVALLGPSTPLLPEAFTDTPVSCLAGIRVREPEGVLQSIAEGQGFRVFKQYVQKVSLRVAGP